jgi:hypothetical protein
MRTKCWVHGCDLPGHQVIRAVHGVGCRNEGKNHIHGNPIQVQVCDEHHALWDELDYLPGLIVPDDPETYFVESS